MIMQLMPRLFKQQIKVFFSETQQATVEARGSIGVKVRQLKMIIRGLLVCFLASLANTYGEFVIFLVKLCGLQNSASDYF